MLPIFSECDDKDVCIGPIIKFAVFDALFGVGCSLMLIFGAHLRNHCLLVSWMVVTLVISTKYIWVVIVNDWSNLEVCAWSLYTMVCCSMETPLIVNCILSAQ